MAPWSGLLGNSRTHVANCPEALDKIIHTACARSDVDGELGRTCDPEGVRFSGKSRE